MKITTLAVIFGAFVAGLGLVGLMSGEGRIAGEAINVNMLLDVTRIALGAMLVIGGLRSAEAARSAMTFFGFAYLGMFALGLVSPNLFGALPAGLGWIDQLLHSVGGAGALLFSAQSAHRGRYAV